MSAFTDIISLLTVLCIYTGEYKPKARLNARPKRESIMRAAGFGFARIDAQAS